MQKSLSNMSGVPIERLTGRDNFTTWKIAVNAFLDLDDLWDGVVELNDRTPADPDKDRKARNKLKLCIDPICYAHIQNARTASEIWESLNRAFEDNGLTRRCGLLRKLIMTSYENCSSMEVYVNEIVNTAHQLNGIGLKVDEEWVGMLLLCGLPESYRPMIMALENSGMKITGDAIKTKLLQEMAPHEKDLAFAGTNRPVRQARPKNKRPIRCFNCGGDHFLRNCKEPPRDNDANGVGDKGGNAMCTVLSAISTKDEDNWFFDSAATTHMTKSQRKIVDPRRCEGQVVAADGRVLRIESRGNVKLKPSCRRDDSPVNLMDVRYVPGLTANLLSVSEIVKKGLKVVFDESGCQVINGRVDTRGKVVATGEHVNNLFVLKQARQHTAMSATSSASFDVWHRRMGHLNAQSLSKLQAGEAIGIKFKDRAKMDCKACAEGKQTKLTISKQGSRAKDILDVVHSDICGPMEEASLAGSRYYLTFIDDKSRRIFIYFLKTKSAEEVLSKFEMFVNEAERQSDRRLKILRSDNGSEYTNRLFQNYLRQKGIVHQKTNPYTPEQNGLAERNNRSITEKARCMLLEAALQKEFWAEAVYYAVYLLNRSPSSGTMMTPQQYWTGEKPNLSSVRIFGTKAMVHVPGQLRKKWDAKSKECILIGIDEHTKGYRLYDLDKDKVFTSRNVVFMNEGRYRNALNDRDSKTTVYLQTEPEEYEVVDLNSDLSSEAGSDVAAEYETAGEGNDSVEEEETLVGESLETPLEEELTNVRRSGRSRAAPVRFQDYEMNFTTTNAPSSSINMRQAHGCKHKPSGEGCPVESEYPKFIQLKDKNTRMDNNSQTYTDDPMTVEDALSRPDAAQWKLAMEVEHQALMENRTWELVNRPKDRKVIKCKWIFKTKRDLTGNVDRYKARLVIKGYQQRKGVDYSETYSPVVRHSSLRYLLALAAQRDMCVVQMDAVSAYLQGTLHEEIFMEQPAEYVDPENPGKCCRLLKALYGLKQGGRVWNQELDMALREFGLKKSDYDPCVYFNNKDGRMLIIAVYVDDLLLFYDHEDDVNVIRKQLHQRFKMKDLGPVEHILGMRVIKGINGFSIDQEHYIDAVLEKFGLSDCNPVDTPMNSSLTLTKEDCPITPEEQREMSKNPYQEAIGCLMYISQCTRPDIAFAVSKLSRFNANPGRKHWDAVKHLLRFLKGSKSCKLSYSQTCSGMKYPSITGYVDADHGSETTDRKSVTGYVFIAGYGAVSWNSKKQTTIAISSCEAEFVALSSICQEAKWWNGFVRELGDQVVPMELFCDNQSAIHISEGDGFNPRSKHIDIRHKFVQESVAHRDVTVSHISTIDQRADVLTKPLSKIKFRQFQNELGVHV